MPSNINDYIVQFPDEVQVLLNKVRRVIAEAAPGAEEAMSYGIPTFRLNGNLVHFAAFNSHIGFYPTPSGIKHFQEELSAYRPAKGSVKFPFDEPIPFDLIEKIVKFRAGESKNK